MISEVHGANGRAARPSRWADATPRSLTREAPSEESALVHAIGQLGARLDARLTALDHRITGALGLLSSGRPGAPPSGAETKPATVAVSCLGAFSFAVDDVTVENWRSGKARALFQYLVNYRERPIAHGRLIETLWPNPDALAAGTSLKVAVHALRQVLNEVKRDGVSLAIISHGSTYQLSAPQLWLDVDEFDRCYSVGRALEAQGQTAAALALYARAADLYMGDFLEEVCEDWAVFRRESLKDQYLSILTALARAAMDCGDYQSCILRCRQLLEKDRCREDSYRLLMLCHGRLGQRGRVRSWYELCARTLKTELDIGPEPETDHLYRLALAGQA